MADCPQKLLAESPTEFAITFCYLVLAEGCYAKGMWTVRQRTVTFAAQAEAFQLSGKFDYA